MSYARTQNHKKVPVYVYFMLFVTFLYLTIEVPFSLHLIKFMGGNPSASDIDDIEVIGRLLTGVAVAIFVMGLMLPKMAFKSKIGSSFLVLLAVVTSIGGTFTLLNYVADMTGSSSTPVERHNAFVTNILKREIAENGVGGINNTNSNDWLVFVSVIPSLVKDTDSLKNVVGTNEVNLFSNEAQRSLNSVKAARHLFFKELNEITQNSYIEYEKGRVEYNASMAKIETAMNSEWDRFQKESYRRIGYTNNINRYAPQARQALRKRGLFFKANENPYNRITFNVVFMNKYGKPARDAFAIESKKRLGVAIAPDYNFYGFSTSDAFQQKIRNEFNISRGVIINENMTDQDFIKYVQQPLITYNKKMYASAFNAPVSKFADGNEFAGLGVNAVKMISIPVMAILLSMAGAILHIHKFSAYLIQVINHKFNIKLLGRASVRHIIVASTIMGAVFTAGYASNNSIIKNETYAEITDGSMVGVALATTISVQPYFAKIGESLSMIGTWSLVENHIPAPNLFAATNVVKDISVNVAEVSISEFNNIPIPAIRPVQ